MRVFRKFVLIALPATLAAALLMALLIEGWVRLSWDARRGTPGFFVSHPVRGQRLGFNYQGWFAGVPVRTNALGFRSDRNDTIVKGPNTFRILVLGDSVTFGHGAVHDYPSLLERHFKTWRPETDWQVWNLGVPGYNTSQELAQLAELGPAYQPDVVVVGFFLNDIIGNRPAGAPGLARRAASRALAWLQRRLYSIEFYKRVILTAQWRLSGTESSRMRFESLESEERMRAPADSLADSAQQQVTPFTRMTDEEVARLSCTGGMRPSAEALVEMQARDDWPAFVAAVQQLQRLHRDGAYKIVFFLNIVPPICPDGDWFYDGKSIENDYFMALFSDGTPAVSAYDEFLHVRPSQMPLADAHAIGNANELKAQVLFRYLRDTVLSPPATR